MDVTAYNAVFDSLNLFKDSSLSVLAGVIPIAGVVLISVSVVGFAIKFFQKLTHTTPEFDDVIGWRQLEEDEVEEIRYRRMMDMD